MWGSRVDRSTLQGRINRLKNHNNGALEDPHENTLVSARVSGYALSPSRESEIASNLAFISATSDDREKIMAACVEEQPDKKGIIIRVACNTGNPPEIVENMSKIALVLEDASQRSDIYSIEFAERS